MKRILVVEDDIDNRDLMVTILEFHGYETVRANNGRHALEIAAESQPDLIMMDISMPIVNGLEAARLLKEDPTLAHIPIVALSAYDSRSDEVDALEAGCVAFFSKPVDMFELKEQLDRILDEQPTR